MSEPMHVAASATEAPAKVVKITAHSQPTLFVAIGRQRVGKTTFLKVLTELTRQQGGRPEVWNTDSLNKSHTISSLGDYVLEPDSTRTEKQVKWLEQRIENLVQTRQDAILDIGGGWTAMHELIDKSHLVSALSKIGVNLVTVFMIGIEKADIDYLDELQRNKRFASKKTVIVLNEGLIPIGLDTADAKKRVIMNPTIIRALGEGAVFAVFPNLNGLKEVTDREQTFIDFAGDAPSPDGLPTSVFDRLRVMHWLRCEVPAFLQELGPEYLPRMPKGLPEVELEAE